MKNVIKKFTFSKFIVAGMLAIALFAFLAPQQAHAASKKKLTEDEVKRIFAAINENKSLNTYEVSQALKVITNLMDEKKKDKSISKAARDGIEDLLGLNKYYSMFANTRDLLSMSYDYYKGDANTQKAQLAKGTKLMFDLIEFSGGLVLPGGYVRTIVASGKAALAAMNKHYGEQSYYSYVEKYYDSRAYGKCFDPEYELFARAWYAYEYYTVDKKSPKTQLGRDTDSLFNIANYIKALEVLRKAGLIN